MLAFEICLLYSFVQYKNTHQYECSNKKPTITAIITIKWMRSKLISTHGASTVHQSGPMGRHWLFPRLHRHQTSCQLLTCSRALLTITLALPQGREGSPARKALGLAAAGSEHDLAAEEILAQPESFPLREDPLSHLYPVTLCTLAACMASLTCGCPWVVLFLLSA